MSTKRKALAPAKLARPVVKAAANLPSKMTINESSTAVSVPQSGIAAPIETIEISSGSDSSDDLSAEEAESDAEDVKHGGADSDAEERNPRKHLLAKSSTRQSNDIAQFPSPNHTPPKDDVQDEADVLDSDAEPTFGELLRGQETIDVPAHLSGQLDESRLVAPQPSHTQIQVPPASSLSTVLSQALRTDDTDLLESCLHTNNLTTIRSTIERLDTSLAGVLLLKLASRLHRRPGRAGSLMTWVQWTLVAHGGTLAAQPDVIKKLSELQKVLAERARGLNQLLVLKGKLDMLDSQMQLRRAVQRRRAEIEGGEDGSDEEGLIWAEGDDMEDTDMAGGSSSKRKAIDSEEAEEGIMPVTNGIIGDSDEEEEDDVEDVESEDDAEDAENEDDVDHDDLDESIGEDEGSDVDAAPPAKVQKVTSAFSKRK